MAITTLDGLIASAKQGINYGKTATRTTVALGIFTIFDLAGNPGSGTLAGANTANGVVPASGTAGYPVINAFGGGNTGYLIQTDFAWNVAGRLRLFDQLFKAGAYGFASGTTNLTAQPSYAARVPATDYKETQIWIEVTTAFAAGNNWQVQVGYTNQDGTTGRNTVILPPTANASLTLGRCYQLALQAGDSGVQRIDSVTITNGAIVMTAGAFNVMVLRPLFDVRVRVANDGGNLDFNGLGMPQVFATSALYLLIQPDGTAGGLQDVALTIANG